MTWKALGTLGLEERVNRALALSRYLPLCVRVCVYICVCPCISVLDSVTVVFARSEHVLPFVLSFHLITVFSAPTMD